MRKFFGTATALLCLMALIVGCGGSSVTSSSNGSRQGQAPAPTTTATTSTSTSTSSTSTLATVAPAAGTQLANFNGNGRVNVITTGNGFDIVDSLFDITNNVDQSTVTSYDAAGHKRGELAPGSLTGECGLADVVVPGHGRLLVGYLVTNTPAQGIQPGTTSTQIKAWNAQTGAAVWSAKLFNADPGCTAYDGNLQDFSSTPNGRLGVVAGKDRNGGYVIDLTSGAVRQDPDAIGTLGNYAVDDPGHDPGKDNATYRLTDPATGGVVGKVSSTTIGLSNQGDLAPTGLFSSLFATDSNTEPAAAGTSSDGSRLLATAQNDNLYGPNALTGYGLPSMRVLWTKEVDQPSLMGDGGDVLVVVVHNCTSDGAACLTGYNDQNGAQLWKVPFDAVCGLTNSQMLIQVNGDLAVIDLKTGKQLSYAPVKGADCPEIHPGGIEVDTGANNGDPTATQTLGVKQILAP